MNDTTLPVLRGHGGARAGAGRPKRAGPVVLQTLKAEPITLRKKFKLMPLDYCLQLINDPEVSRAEKLEAARICSPYLHVRLSSIQVTNDKPNEPVTSRVIDVSKLSDNELVELRRILTKATPVVLENEPSALLAGECDEELLCPSCPGPDNCS